MLLFRWQERRLAKLLHGLKRCRKLKKGTHCFSLQRNFGRACGRRGLVALLAAWHRQWHEGRLFQTGLGCTGLLRDKDGMWLSHKEAHSATNSEPFNRS